MAAPYITSVQGPPSPLDGYSTRFQRVPSERKTATATATATVTAADSSSAAQCSASLGRSFRRFDAPQLNLHDGHNVIDLEDHPHALGGQLQRARVHEHRLNDVLRVHVANGALAHVDPCTRGAQPSE